MSRLYEKCLQIFSRKYTNILLCFESLKGKDRLEELGLHVDGRIILKWVVSKQEGRAWTRLVTDISGSRGGVVSLKYFKKTTRRYIHRLICLMIATGGKLL
jgi:hypothetical protein